MMSNLQFPPENWPLILAVDTSSARASFAIARGPQVIASRESAVSIPHSKTFFDLLSSLLQTTGLSLAQIGAFAAATGPGSFTGLRVGLSAIKGLSHPLGKPALGINSIDAAALTAKIIGKILVMINAGREEVYAGVRHVGADGDIISFGADLVGPLSSIIESLAAKTLLEPLSVISVGAWQGPVENLPSHWQPVTAGCATAEAIAIHASHLLQHHAHFDLHPHYIRPSDAEIKKS
jgi:tRNA threonylcarbamoyladenosine biosynthesis protein TsaB